MAEISVIPPAGGEAIQLGPVQMRILEDGRTTGHRLGVGEITIAAHADGPPQHRHARHDEGFYVVSGTARFTVADTTYDAPAGTFVMIPPGAPHTFANPAGEAGGPAEHLHARSVRAVLPRPARHDRRGAAHDTGERERGDEPLRHRARQ